MSNNPTDILVQQFKKSFELSQFGAQLVQTANFIAISAWPVRLPSYLKGLGRDIQLASSFLVMAIVGGAIFPPVLGWIAKQPAAWQWGISFPLLAFLE